MIRLFVVMVAIFGSALLYALLFPQMRNIAFTLGGIGITWVWVASGATGFLTYKITK